MQPSGPVVYSELSDYLGLTKNTHESTFFDAIFLFSRIILIYYPYGIMAAVSSDRIIGTFRIIFLLVEVVQTGRGALIREGTPQDICPMTTYLLIKCPDILILKWPNTDKMSRIIPKNIPVLKNLLSLKILKRSLLLVGRYLNNCRYYAVSQ